MKEKAKGQYKERKKNWRELKASPEEIKQMLEERVLLRLNEVRGRPEVHYLSKGPVIGKNELGLLSIFGGEGGVTDGYENLSDRDVNSLWVELSKEKQVLMQDLRFVLGSDFVPKYHPFRFYLDNLPRWTEDQDDAIMGLALTVNVKGGAEEQVLFYQYLKKWLVAMVASWVDSAVVNQTMLVLIGPQGAYKTTWFQNLLPPQLQNYFYTKTNSGILSKDDMIVLAEYGLVCWEELDSMLAKEMNKLKAAMTMKTVNERAAYAHYHESRPRIASFCGTGNNLQFLSDTTGTRRWLPFEVESIESPLTTPFDHDAIYSQAYALYKQGFQYWFSSKEIAQLQKRNAYFETSCSEFELIDEHFQKPSSEKDGEYLSAVVILQMIGGTVMKDITTVKLGRALTQMGFDYKTIHGVRRYHVVRRTPGEIEARRQQPCVEEQGGEGVEVW